LCEASGANLMLKRKYQRCHRPENRHPTNLLLPGGIVGKSLAQTIIVSNASGT